MSSRKKGGQNVVRIILLVILPLIFLKEVEATTTTTTTTATTIFYSPLPPSVSSAPSPSASATTTAQSSSSPTPTVASSSPPPATEQTSSSSVSPTTSAPLLSQTSTVSPSSTPSSTEQAPSSSVSPTTTASSLSQTPTVLPSSTPSSTEQAPSSSVSPTTTASSLSQTPTVLPSSTPSSTEQAPSSSVSPTTPASSLSQTPTVLPSSTPSSTEQAPSSSVSPTTPASSLSQTPTVLPSSTPSSTEQAPSSSVSPTTPASSLSQTPTVLPSSTPSATKQAPPSSVSPTATAPLLPPTPTVLPSSAPHDNSRLPSKGSAATVQPSPTSSTTASVTPVPQADKVKHVYIQMTFTVPWGRFCSLISLFKESLSRDVIEFEGLNYEYVPTQRIKLMNAKEKCSNRSYYNDEVILKFYIAKREQNLGGNDTDKELTIKTFKILHGYWVNKRMILLDKVFEGKVAKVELIGDDPLYYVDKYTEDQRIGIGIGVGLALIVLFLIVLFCVKGHEALKQVGRQPEDKKMVFTNVLALEEDNASGNASQPLESQAQPRDEPEEVVIHTQASPPRTETSEPVTKAQDETPLLSAIGDYEDGKKVDGTDSDERPVNGQASLAKPDPDNVSQGEPIKVPDETEAAAAPDDTAKDDPAKLEKGVTGDPTQPEKEGTDEPTKPEEEGIGERKPTFTSSVTIVVTPDASGSQAFEFPTTEHPPEPKPRVDSLLSEETPADTDDAGGEESAKPNFGQSDNSDADPTQGAINMGFDDKDEAADDKKEKEEETKF